MTTLRTDSIIVGLNMYLASKSAQGILSEDEEVIKNVNDFIKSIKTQIQE